MFFPGASVVCYPSSVVSLESLVFSYRLSDSFCLEIKKNEAKIEESDPSKISVKKIEKNLDLFKQMF